MRKLVRVPALLWLVSCGMLSCGLWAFASAATYRSRSWTGTASLSYEGLESERSVGTSDVGTTSTYWYSSTGNWMSKGKASDSEAIHLPFSALTLRHTSGVSSQDTWDLFLSGSTSGQYDRRQFPANTVIDWATSTSFSSGEVSFFNPSWGRSFSELYRYLHFREDQIQSLSTSTTKLVVVIHGWNPDSFEDPHSAGQLNACVANLTAVSSGTEWRSLTYDWASDAATGPKEFNGTNPTEAAECAVWHGRHLAQRLAARFPNLKKVHFIAHSAGSWVARTAARNLLLKNSSVRVQVSLLDPFIPDVVLGIDSNLSTSLMNELDAVSGSTRLYLLENYFSDDDIFWILGLPGTQEIFGWRGTDINRRVDVNSGSSKYSGHDGPIEFYSDTIRATRADAGDVSALADFNLLDLGWRRSLFYNDLKSVAVAPDVAALNAGTGTTLRSTVRTQGGTDLTRLNPTFTWYRGSSPSTLSAFTPTSSDGNRTISTGNLAQTTYYKLKITDQSTGDEMESSPVAVSVNYTIAVSASPTVGGSVSGAGTFASGSSRTVTASANNGYVFANWTEGGSVVSTAASYTFTVSNNRSLVANFSAVASTYAVAVSAAPAAGGTAGGGGTFAAGTTRTVSATAAAGYIFNNWTESNAVVSTSAAYSFVVDRNRTLVANFSPQQSSYTITLGAVPGHGGTIAGAGTFAAGASRTVTATPNAGFIFVNWTEGAVAVSSATSYTFTLTGNRTLNANFASSAGPVLGVNPTSIAVDARATGIGFFVQNDGQGTLNWTANSPDTWIAVTVSGGSLSSGAQVRVDLSIQANSSASERVGSVVVSAASAGSSPKTVTVRQQGATAATILSQPQRQTVAVGTAASFSVVVGGAAPFDFRWQFSAPGASGWTDVADGGAYSGASSATLTVTATDAFQNFSYRCLVTNVVGTAISDSALLVVVPAESGTPLYGFSTLAGGAESGATDGLRTAARFAAPFGLARDATGNLYVSDYSNHNVRKIAPDGMVTTYAGAAGQAGTADGTGTAARFNSPSGLAFDSAGNLYVADGGNHAIRRITPAGVVTTFAGTSGSRGSADGNGASARFNFPAGLAFDASGNLFVSDYSNATIRKITPAGAVSTFAGSVGNIGSSDGVGSSARFFGPAGLAFDAEGNLYVAEEFNHTLRKITASAVVTTLAGAAGAPGATDGRISEARFYGPVGIARDAAGNLYVTEWVNHTIRRVGVDGRVATLGGSARTTGLVDGAGDMARFNGPLGVIVDAGGTLVIADRNNCVVRQGARLADPSVILPPLSHTAVAGGSTTFTISAAGSLPLTYQWQNSAPGAAGWTDLSNGGVYAGVTTNTLRITGVTDTLSQTSFRCRISNSSGVAHSDSAVLIVVHRPTVSGPSGSIVPVGARATLVVVADGTPPLSYFWQSSGPGASVWSDLSDGADYAGTRTSTLVLQRVAAALDGCSFRCQVFNAAGVAVSESAVIRLLPPPEITAQPTSKSLSVGSDTSFAVGVSASGAVRYYWQVAPAGTSGWTDLDDGGAYTGSRTAVLRVTGATAGLSGNHYRCQVFNEAGHAVSNSAVLTVVSAPRVARHPSSLSIAEGGDASFSIVAEGTGPLDYLWQISPRGSAIWSDLRNGGAYSGTAAATLTVSNASAAIDQVSLRCRVTNSAGVAFSNSAVLGVSPVAPAIVAHPLNRTIIAGGNVTFSIAATGSSPLAYFWQVALPGSTVWTDLVDGGIYSGTRGGTLTVMGAPPSLHGSHYRCQVFNAGGNAVGGSGVLTVLTPPVVMLEPANASGAVGESVNFNLTATGSSPLAYFWQVAARGSTAWTDLGDGDGISGAHSARLILTVTAGMDGNSYRCQIFNSAGYAVSGSATFALLAPPSVAQHPAGATVVMEGTARFTVAADGATPLSYYWQISAPGTSTWSDLSEGNEFSGTHTPTLVVNGVAGSLDQASFRCQIFNRAGYTASNGAVLRVLDPPRAPTISSAPRGQNVLAGQSATFSVSVSGTAPIRYNWQVSAPGSGGWTDLADDAIYSGTRTSTLSVISAAANLDGYSYRCQAFNDWGATASDSAQLTVIASPRFVTHPTNVTVAEGMGSSLSVLAVGTGPLTYCWQISAPGTTTWSDLADNAVYSGARTRSLTLSAVSLALQGGYYRCQVFGPGGAAVSESGVLTIAVAPVITVQPVDRRVPSGAGTSFSIVASGRPPLTFHWQVSQPGMTAWTDLHEASGYGGARTATLSITAVSPAMNGNYYRCQVFNPSGYAISNSGVLTVTSASVTATLDATSAPEWPAPLWARSEDWLLNMPDTVEATWLRLPGEEAFVLPPSWVRVVQREAGEAGGTLEVWENPETSDVAVRTESWYPLAFRVPRGRSGWELVLVADGNGDGVPDLLFVNTETSQLHWVFLAFEVRGG